MADPITILMDEHRLIERVMNAMMTYVEKVRTNPGNDARVQLKRFVEFLREFADRTHHGKEEDILFRQMVECGFPRDGGPIAVMLMEHDQGRAFVRTLQEIAEKESKWTPKDHESIASTAVGFVNLLRQHIVKEDNILYPMVRSHLPPEAMAKIAEEFEKFTGNEEASGDHNRLWKLGKDLASQYSA